jgi:hypothetical protein
MKPGFRGFSAMALASCILVEGVAAGASDFAAAGKDSHDAACFAQALCNALKKTCKGRYQQDNSNVPYGKRID